MPQKNTQEMLTEIISTIKNNTNGEITGNVLQSILADLTYTLSASNYNADLENGYSQNQVVLFNDGKGLRHYSAKMDTEKGESPITNPEKWEAAWSLADQENVKGGHFAILSFQNRIGIPIEKRAMLTRISYIENDVAITYIYISSDVSNVEWEKESNWQRIGSRQVNTIDIDIQSPTVNALKISKYDDSQSVNGAVVEYNVSGGTSSSPTNIPDDTEWEITSSKFLVRNQDQYDEVGKMAVKAIKGENTLGNQDIGGQMSFNCGTAHLVLEEPVDEPPRLFSNGDIISGNHVYELTPDNTLVNVGSNYKHNRVYMYHDGGTINLSVLPFQGDFKIILLPGVQINSTTFNNFGTALKSSPNDLDLENMFPLAANDKVIIDITRRSGTIFYRVYKSNISKEVYFSLNGNHEFKFNLSNNHSVYLESDAVLSANNMVNGESYTISIQNDLNLHNLDFHTSGDFGTIDTQGESSPVTMNANEKLFVNIHKSEAIGVITLIKKIN